MGAMTIRDEVRDLPAYRFTPRAAAVKLDQNESPFDLPEDLRSQALERLAAADWHRYPEMHAESLRARIGSRWDWPDDGVAVAPGSNVLIQALIIAAGLGRRVLTVTPTFSVYELQARVLGVDLTEIPLLRDFGLPLEALLDELERGPGVLFLTTPAAPTGNRHDDADVAALLDAALEHGWTPVIDGAYAEFAGRDSVGLVRRRPGSVVLRTFSKAFGLGGVRLGYALAEPELATHLRKVTLPFQVSALQVAVGQTVLDAPDYVRRRVERIVAERVRVFERLRDDPAFDAIAPFPSDANFVLFRTPDAAHLHSLGGCLRVTIGAESENDLFLHALAASLDELLAGSPPERGAAAQNASPHG